MISARLVHFGTDPNDVDSDGDGIWDRDQLLADPLADAGEPPLPTETGDTGATTPTSTGDTGDTGGTGGTSVTTDPPGPVSSDPVWPGDEDADEGCAGCASQDLTTSWLGGLLTRRRSSTR